MVQFIFYYSVEAFGTSWRADLLRLPNGKRFGRLKLVFEGDAM